MSAGVLVVGGGHNGLVCAAYLARAGLDVTVLEARDEVGGAASTVTALGARVNACNCDHMLIRATPIAEALDLSRHGLRYLEVDPALLALPWNGEAPWFQYRERDGTLASLARSYPGEVEGFRRYMRAALPAFELVVELALAPPAPGRVLRRLVERRGRGAATLLAWSRRSCAGVLRAFFRDDALVAPAAITGPGVWGLSPRVRGTGLGALGYAARQRVPVGRPVGGSGALPLALRSALQAAGGSVRTGAVVRAVALERRRVVGAELDGGELVEASNLVIACDPRRAPLHWRGAPPAEAARWTARIVRGAPDGYQSKVDAVVERPPRYRCLGDEALVPTAVVSPSVAELVGADAAMRRGEIARRPPMLVNVPSALDATMRVGDAHVVSLEPLYTPYVFPWHEQPDEPGRWLEELARLVEPGFLESIRAWRAVTPSNWERDFGMPRGAVQTYAASPLAAALGRERELTRYETPVRGLFLTGSATFPGAGIWGASGRNAAAVILRRVSG